MNKKIAKPTPAVFMLDLKSMIILFFAIISILFFSLWFLKGTGYKKEFKLLEKNFIKLQKTRDSIAKVNSVLKINFNKTQELILSRDKKILLVEEELKKSKIELIKSNDELKKNELTWEENKRGIQNLKKNPIKREGQELINSLQEKLQ